MFDFLSSFCRPTENPALFYSNYLAFGIKNRINNVVSANRDCETARNVLSALPLFHDAGLQILVTVQEDTNEL